MSLRRLALVTRRFWPLMGGAETTIANLACELRERGHRPAVVTAQWERHWPQRIDCREVPLVRLLHPPQPAWGTLRYVGALEKWLARHAAEIDLTYVSNLQYDAYAAIRALGESGVPVVLRASGAGAAGDCHWQENAPFGSRVRKYTQQAAAIVAPSEVVEQELLQAGYEERRVRLIQPGVPLPERRSEEARQRARRVLVAADAALSMPYDAPLAVFLGRFEEASGLNCLLESWPRVVASVPNACLWLVGDGPARDDLARSIRRAGLHGHVALAGPFDHVDDLLNAADMFVLPGEYRGPSQALLEALAHGLPVVAAEGAGNREIITPELNGLLEPVGEVSAWSAAVIRLFEDTELAGKLAAAGRERVAQHFSLAQATTRHEELFEEVIEAAAREQLSKSRKT